MIKIKQILVATDFSEYGNLAVNHAKELAEAFQAKLQVLHVVEEPYGYVGNTHGLLPAADAFRESLNRAARMQLDQVLSADEVQRFDARLSLRTGTPYAEIVRFAQDQDVDLIVVGTHGHRALTHMLLGSVAEKVVRYARCPVLTVRQPEAVAK